MVWDYFETNIINAGLSDWLYMIERILPVITNCAKVSDNIHPSPTVIQDSATNLPWPDNFFDAVLTDPPYYNNVPYSHLSDFFYVWLKRSIGHLYPELFATPLSPKSKEIVAYPNIQGGWDVAKKFFEDMLKGSFKEINRVLKPNGVAVIVYAHKSTAAWETLLNSLLDSGLVVTAAWPISTEMKGRMRAQGSAVLASSIYIVARKLEREKIGFYREVREELRKHLDAKLEKLWKEGVAGADFFIAAIGASIEVFGRFEKIIDDEGKEIRADAFLEVIRTTVTDYAVHKILRNGFTDKISNKTRLYLLWRWSYGEGNSIPFDDARKLAQSVGIDLTKEWDKRMSFIQKNSELVGILGPEDREWKDGRVEQEILESRELIDVLHYILQLWRNGKRDELVRILIDSGYGQSDVFYRVAQAISETLPNTSREKKLLDGFLAGKGRLFDDIRKTSGQKRLSEY
jgi:adenine-specific DNA methylase